MYRRVEETMLATIQVRHSDARGHTVWEDTGTIASMEIFGEVDRLVSISPRKA